MEEFKEELGQAIDSLDNYIGALQLPMPSDFHVKQLKEELPSLSNRFKEAFKNLFNENPWE